MLLDMGGCPYLQGAMGGYAVIYGGSILFTHSRTYVYYIVTPIVNAD